MAGLFLGIDVGTGGVRACAIDARGNIQGAESTTLPPPRQDGNAIDQEPELVVAGDDRHHRQARRQDRSRRRRADISRRHLGHAAADR